MKLSANVLTRKFHRWGALVTCIPLFLVIATGIVLQIKKQSTWIQPATEKGTQGDPTVDWNKILLTTAANSNSGVKTWADIDRLDVRPSKGVIKVRCKNRWEIQIDASTGHELSSAYRRSDLIESLHDGSFFADWTKLWIFLPNGIILLGLWFTGIYLWYLPISAKRKKKKRLKERSE